MIVCECAEVSISHCQYGLDSWVQSWMISRERHDSHTSAALPDRRTVPLSSTCVLLAPLATFNRRKCFCEKQRQTPSYTKQYAKNMHIMYCYVFNKHSCNYLVDSKCIGYLFWLQHTRTGRHTTHKMAERASLPTMPSHVNT